MTILLYVLATVVTLLLALLLLLAVGLLIKPRSFARYPEGTQAFETVPLPKGLPTPVERYFRVAVGDLLPVIRSAVMSGRAHLRIRGLRLPARWRFTHVAGYDYRHYIETTLFGRPLMRVNEWYLGGKARLELPFGVIADDPKTDAAANLGLWGETMFLPTVFLTDARVRWESVSEHQARLLVPFGGGEDAFTVSFDPGTGLIARMEALRWKEPTSVTKTNWVLEPLGWARYSGMLLPSAFAITWADDRLPWFVGRLEEIQFNGDVGTYIRAKGA